MSLASSLNRACGVNMRHNDRNNAGNFVPCLPDYVGKSCTALLGRQHQAGREKCFGMHWEQIYRCLER